MRIMVADDDNVRVISSSWCRTRMGIVLSFAISIDVMSVDELKEFSDMFMDAVDKSYGEMIKNLDMTKKSSTPLVSAVPDGESIMIWSFVCDDTVDAKLALRNAGIPEMKY